MDLPESQADSFQERLREKRPQGPRSGNRLAAHVALQMIMVTQLLEAQPCAISAIASSEVPSGTP